MAEQMWPTMEAILTGAAGENGAAGEDGAADLDADWFDAARRRRDWDPGYQWMLLPNGLPPPVTGATELGISAAEVRLIVETSADEPDFHHRINYLLCWAAASDRFDSDSAQVVDLLLNDRPRPTADPGCFGNAPINYALAANNEPATRLLLEHIDAAAVQVRPNSDPLGEMRGLADTAVIEARYNDDGCEAASAVFADGRSQLTGAGVTALFQHLEIAYDVNLEGYDGDLLVLMASQPQGATVIRNLMLAHNPSDEPFLSFVIERFVPALAADRRPYMYAAMLDSMFRRWFARPAEAARVLGAMLDGWSGALPDELDQLVERCYWLALSTGSGELYRLAAPYQNVDTPDLVRAAGATDPGAVDVMLAGESSGGPWTRNDLENALAAATPATQLVLQARLLGLR